MLSSDERPLAAVGAPLSPNQERLWVAEQLDPHTVRHCAHRVVAVHGALQPNNFGEALREMSERHGILRSTFTAKAGRPERRATPMRLVSKHADLRRVPSSQRRATALAHLEAAVSTPLDLGAGPLVHVQVLRMSDTLSWLMIHAHRMVADERSLDLCLAELHALYRARCEGRGATGLAARTATYRAFVLRQRRLVESQRGTQLLQHWRERLEGAPALLELPTDRPRPAVETHRGEQVVHDVPRPVVAELERWCAARGRTLVDALLAAWSLVIQRHSGQSELVLGTPFDGRGTGEEQLIGSCSSSLALRVDLAGNPTFAELVARVQRVAAEARAHGALPFAVLARELAGAAPRAHHPLFQASFALREEPPEAGDWILDPSLAKRAGGPASDPTERPPCVHDGAARLDLALELTRTAAGLSVALEYSTDLFRAATAERLAARLVAALSAVPAEADTPLDRFPILPDDERHELLVKRNASAFDAPLDTPLHRLIEAQVARNPHAAALVFEGQEVSYAELNRRANRLARLLLELGAGPDRAVAIFMQRGVDSVVAMLATFKAGGTYVPLDPIYPGERLHLMLADSGAPVLLTHDALADRVPRGTARVVNLDAEAERVASRADGDLELAVDPQVGSYVIFTSGSTGRPKGVVLTQRGLVNFLTWWQHAFPLRADDRVLHKTSCAFDPSMFELFWPLLVGARMVIARPGGDRDNGYLVQLIRQQRVTVGFAVPSALLLFLDEPGVEECTTLRYFFTGGEPVPVAVADAFHARLSARLNNIYGPAEATCTVATGEALPQPDARTVPFGFAVGNTQLYVLDANLEPVPIGVAGELYIGGDSVGRGYMKQPGLTADRFVPDPFAQRPGARLYRTGDVVRYRAGGVLESLGRNDNQVKVRGYRIELGEIEALLRRHPALRETAVVVHETETGDKQIVAHLLAEGADRPGRDELHGFLKDELPDYMLPSYFMYHEEFPRTMSGKLERKALPPPPKEPGLGGEYVAPRDADETRLARIWAEVLSVGRVGVRDNFFELGGHSLTAVAAVKRVRDSYGIDFGLQHFLMAPTVEELARAIRERSSA
ncbi:MAG: amino acid adenylation domain-containing protein [Planctomycetota bacterium]